MSIGQRGDQTCNWQELLRADWNSRLMPDQGWVLVQK